MNNSRCEYDEPYTWCRRPETYLAPREIVRLTILRSRLGPRADLRNRVVRSRRRRRANAAAQVVPS